MHSCFHTRRARASAAALLLLLAILLGCSTACTGFMPDPAETSPIQSLTIENGGRITLAVGDSLQLHTNVPAAYQDELTWLSSSDAVDVTDDGYVTARETGKALVSVSHGDLSDRTLIEVVEATDAPETTPDTTPDGSETAGETESETGGESGGDSGTTPESRPTIPEAEGSPEGYTPAASLEEALDRASRGEIAGYDFVPDQAPVVEPDRPMVGGQYIRNTDTLYDGEDTYIVVDAQGREVFRVYRGGGYITLEEIAAYLYAFGDIPANYVSSKVTNVGSSMWGEYLRGNHSKFSGSTSKYPYEPELPRISGCGGDLQYYEIDIGTTGTDCDPGYAVTIYNNGTKITRGAARIVYARFDSNGNRVIDPDEKYIFYTYNHYNDFQEYLNYYNGWGDMFGNITGGGTLSSKYDYNPTPYIQTALESLSRMRTARTTVAIILPYDPYFGKAWAA